MPEGKRLQELMSAFNVPKALRAIAETMNRSQMGSITAIVKTNCKLAFLARERFLFAVQETPMFALKVMKSYSERLNRLAHTL